MGFDFTHSQHQLGHVTEKTIQYAYINIIDGLKWSQTMSECKEVCKFVYSTWEVTERTV